MSEPHLQQALARTMHEVQTPLVAIRSLLERVNTELQERGIQLDEDYIADAWNWSELLVRLLRNAQILVAGENASLSISRVSFIRDVVAPAVAMVSPLLRERGHASEAIRLHRLEVIPPLFADKKLLQQAFVSLLINCITYSANRLRIEISAIQTNKGWAVRVSDWGVGVHPSESSNIFQEGFRGTGAQRFNISGNGIGLFVANYAMQRHGGTIALTNLCEPTEFTLFFPGAMQEPTVPKHETHSTH